MAWEGVEFEPIRIEDGRYKRPTGTLKQEMWAASFWCPNHGTCTHEMVTTKKTCLWCGDGLLRHAGYLEDLPWLAVANALTQDS